MTTFLTIGCVTLLVAVIVLVVRLRQERQETESLTARVAKLQKSLIEARSPKPQTHSSLPTMPNPGRELRELVRKLGGFL